MGASMASEGAYPPSATEWLPAVHSTLSNANDIRAGRRTLLWRHSARRSAGRRGKPNSPQLRCACQLRPLTLVAWWLLCKPLYHCCQSIVKACASVQAPQEAERRSGSGS